MNSDAIFAAIESIADTRSRSHKVAIIGKHAGDEGFKRVLQAALDPFVTYGIASVPAYNSDGGGSLFDDETWNLLDRLAHRELTGNAARNALADELSSLTRASSELLKRIITKDLRAGISASTVNKVIPGLIPTFDCMLAHPFDPVRVTTWPVIVEPKYDGVRVLAFVTISATPTVKFYSRSGKEFTAFEHLKQPLIDAIEAWAPGDGEWVVDGEVVSGSFNKTVSEVRRKNEQATDAVYLVFELLERKAFDTPNPDGYCLNAPTLHFRRRLVDDVFGTCSSPWPTFGGRQKVIGSPWWEAQDVERVHELYSTWRDMHLEGAIVKLPGAYYRKDRDYGWMKLKAEETIDVPIIGAEPGTGKYASTLGALVVDFNGVSVRVSGMTDSQRDDMWQAYLADMAAGDNDKDRFLLGRLAEIEYHEITPDGSLRHPRFKRFRDDKVLQRVRI